MTVTLGDDCTCCELLLERLGGITTMGIAYTTGATPNPASCTLVHSPTCTNPTYSFSLAPAGAGGTSHTDIYFGLNNCFGNGYSATAHTACVFSGTSSSGVCNYDTYLGGVLSSSGNVGSRSTKGSIIYDQSTAHYWIAIEHTVGGSGWSSTVTAYKDIGTAPDLSGSFTVAIGTHVSCNADGVCSGVGDTAGFFVGGGSALVTFS